eukprot:scaffold141352_cov130-Phaeocystis_antarctica.AAC.1
MQCCASRWRTVRPVFHPAGQTLAVRARTPYDARSHVSRGAERRRPVRGGQFFATTATGAPPGSGSV